MIKIHDLLRNVSTIKLLFYHDKILVSYKTLYVLKSLFKLNVFFPLRKLYYTRIQCP